jgi:beta-aspartyl-dipeptidase (metallo-type)
LSRNIPTLLARAAALDAEGITALCYTGGWKYPVPTLTGDPQADVAYVPRVVGVKVPISEAMAPVRPLDELCRLAHEAFTGGLLAGKRSVLHTHIGDHPEGLTQLQDVQRRSGIPPDRLVATHVNRNPELWQQAMVYARGGGSIDLTGMQRPDCGYPNGLAPADAIQEALATGVPAERITLSSDGGAAYPRLDAEGAVLEMYTAGPESLLRTVRELVDQGLTWEQAVRFCSAHVADLLGLLRKGYVRPGRDADLLILTAAGQLDTVLAKGRIMVRAGQAAVQGSFGTKGESKVR